MFIPLITKPHLQAIKAPPPDTLQEKHTPPQVINAFHLIDIAEPGRVIGEFRRALEGKDVHGRIYISEQGLNAQFGGRRDDALAFAKWIAAHPLFQVGVGGQVGM